MKIHEYSGRDSDVLRARYSELQTKFSKLAGSNVSSEKMKSLIANFGESLDYMILRWEKMLVTAAEKDAVFARAMGMIDDTIRETNLLHSRKMMEGKLLEENERELLLSAKDCRSLLLELRMLSDTRSPATAKIDDDQTEQIFRDQLAYLDLYCEFASLSSNRQLAKNAVAFKTIVLEYIDKCAMETKLYDEEVKSKDNADKIVTAMNDAAIEMRQHAAMKLLEFGKTAMAISISMVVVTIFLYVALGAYMIRSISTAENDLKAAYKSQLFISRLLSLSVDISPMNEILKRASEIIGQAEIFDNKISGAIFLYEGSPQVLLRKASWGKSNIPDDPNNVVFAHSIPIKTNAIILGYIKLTSTGEFTVEKGELETISSYADVLASVIIKKSMEDTIARGKDKVEQLLSSITIGVIGIDNDMMIIHWNKAMEEITGSSAKSVMGKAIYECMLPWTQDTGPGFVSGFPENDDGVVKTTLRYHNQAGQEKFVDIIIVGVKGTGGNGREYLIHVIDVTDLKLLESQLVQSQKLEAIGQLAAGIAHEINTPTQFVGDNARFLKTSFADMMELLKDYNSLDNIKTIDELKTFLTKMQTRKKNLDLDYLVDEIPASINQTLEGVERISKIVLSMKEFSHPGGKVKEAVDVNKAIASTVTVARSEWKYVADLDLQLQPDLPMLTCLPGEFNQVILNLIVNAAQAIGGMKKEGLGKITISTKNDAEAIEIRVSDNGPGIPPEIKHRIFEPFFTTKEVGKGTGQGLAMVHSTIVEKHKGTVTVESEVGKGTTFIVRIPLLQQL